MQYSRQNQKFSKNMLILLQRIFFEELSDPIFRRITINHLQINAKKTLATIYLDIENAGAGSRAIEKLDILKVFLRRRLGDELTTFKIPHLKFVNDRTFSQALRVENLINSSKHE